MFFRTLDPCHWDGVDFIFHRGHTLCGGIGNLVIEIQTYICARGSNPSTPLHPLPVSDLLVRRGKHTSVMNDGVSTPCYPGRRCFSLSVARPSPIRQISACNTAPLSGSSMEPKATTPTTKQQRPEHPDGARQQDNVCSPGRGHDGLVGRPYAPRLGSVRGHALRCYCVGADCAGAPP